MGLLEQNPLDWLRGTISGQGEAKNHLTAEFTDPRIEKRIAERTAARRARRYAEADRIRTELAKEGITLEDHPDGTTTWRRGA
jgi:cysteinyl-tRNA synthetase